MKRVQKSVLLWYSASEMADLVTDIPRYPQFLPWCDKAEVLQQHADGVTARLGLAFKGLRHAFTTKNTRGALGDNTQVQLALVDGPFSLLQGQWTFVPLGLSVGQPAGPSLGPSLDQPVGHQRACKVEFDLRYAFSSKALELLISPMFDHVASTFVDAFVQRAEVVYGKR